MDNSFDIRRCGKLFADDVKLNWRKYALALCAVAGVPFVISMLATISEYGLPPSKANPDYYSHDLGLSVERCFFWIMLFIYGAVCASLIFSSLAGKAGRISYLMLPASQLEKYLSRVGLMVAAALIAFVTAYELQDALRVLLSTIIYGKGYEFQCLGLSMFSDEKVSGTVLCVFFSLQSYFALGSAIWPNRSALKTFGVLSALSIGLQAVTLAMYAIMAFRGGCFPDFHDHFETIMIANCILACVVNYTLAYFRFKEQEIIDRW